MKSLLILILGIFLLNTFFSFIPVISPDTELATYFPYQCWFNILLIFSWLLPSRTAQYLFDDTYKETNLTALDILEALKDPYNDIEDVNVYEYIYSANLTDSEQNFLKLRYDGLTMEEISYDLGESSYKVRQTLREKISLLEIEYEKISQTG